MTLFPAIGRQLKLRNYQADAVDRLRNGIIAGVKRQVLCSPTGSGKTFIAAWMARRAAEMGNKVVFVADRIALVNQTSERFSEFGIQHGVLQGSNSRNRNSQVLVCSAQTLEKRGFFPELDLIFVDECHTQRIATSRFLTEWNGPAIGLTATPFTRGMGKVWQRCIQTQTTDRLTELGWLAPLRVYRGAEADMEGAKTAAGEWTAKEVATRGRTIIGDIVSNWVSKSTAEFGGPQKTLVFSATVDHGEEVCAAFQEAGFDFRQISYRDNNDERRKRLIKAYEQGEIMGLVSCEALAKGFDVPDTRILVAARNYRSSLAAHIQQIGRVMRAAPNKEFGLVLDHAGNWLRFREDTLAFFRLGMFRKLDDGKRKKIERRQSRPRTDLVCRGCGFIMQPSMDICPACGKERKRKNVVTVVPAELTRDRLTEERMNVQDNGKHYWGQVCRIALDRKGAGEEAERCARAYYKQIVGSWPGWTWRFTPAPYVDDSVDKALNSRWRRWSIEQQRKLRRQERV